MLVMPIFTQNSSKFSYTIILDGVAYYFDFYWNTRESCFYMSISDVAQNIIIPGIKLVVGHFLLKQWAALPVPPGDFLILDSTGQNKLPITLTSLGAGIHQLFYITAAEKTSGIISGVQ